LREAGTRQLEEIFLLVDQGSYVGVEEQDEQEALFH
jgi:hypothetical protein